MSTESRIEARDAKAAGGVVAEGWQRSGEVAIRWALGLFPSVIKCGEAWTSSCQQALDDAKAALTALTAAQAREVGLREALWLFREYVIRNATNLTHHHPIWAATADMLDDMPISVSSGPAYRFTSRKTTDVSFDEARTALSAPTPEAPDHD